MPATVTPDPAAPTMTWDQFHEAGRRRFAEGDAAGAEQAFRAAIAQADRADGDPLQLASSLSSLGQLKYQQKEYAGAEDCFRRSLELRERALGSDHPTVISGINNLAALYVARGALDDAEPLLQRAMSVTVKRVEATQNELAVNLNNLVRLYVKRGDYARAEPLVVRLLALRRPLGPEHPDVAAVLVTLAKLRQSMGQSEAAERLWRRVLAVRQRTLAPNDPLLASTIEGLADVCAAQGKSEQELALRERALTSRIAAVGADHGSLDTLKARLAALRQVIPAGPSPRLPGASRSANGRSDAVPVASAAASNVGPSGMATGVTGLTGVNLNVFPEAVAASRAVQEASEVDDRGGQEPVRESSAGSDSLRGPSGSPVDAGPPLAERSVATPRPSGHGAILEGLTRPSAVPEMRRPAPMEALDAAAMALDLGQAGVSGTPATSSPAMSAMGGAHLTPTHVLPTPGGVKWIDPSHVVQPPAHDRPSGARAQASEGGPARPKVRMSSRVDARPSGHGKVIALAAAAIIVLAAIAAAVYGRGRRVSDSPEPVGHAGAPGGTADQRPGGVNGSGAATPTPPAAAPRPQLTPSPSASTAAGSTDQTTARRVPDEPGHAAAAFAPDVKPIATPVRMTVTPRVPSRPVQSHRTAAATPASDTAQSMPSIDIDAATRAVDEAAKTHSSPPSTAP